jgi:hypothetical protein
MIIFSSFFMEAFVGFLRALVFLSLVFVVGACSQMKNLDEMHDSTQKMSDTTDKMNKTTTDLDGKTERVEKMTDELYDALRQGNALQLRREAYESILKAPTMFKKISEGAKYFMSYEFQLWNMNGQDMEPGRRDLLEQQAAKEFFLEIEELAPRDNSVDPTVEPTTVSDSLDYNNMKNREASFNALAVTMDQMNRKQNGSISMYSIMVDALFLPREQVQATGAAREVLPHKEKAIQLLQARYNMFPMMYVDMISKVGAKNTASKAWMWAFGWDAHLEKLNATQLDYLRAEVIDKALESKAVLIKLGEKPVMNAKLKRFLTHMRIQKNLSATAPEKALEKSLEDLRRDLR